MLARTERVSTWRASFLATLWLMSRMIPRHAAAKIAINAVNQSVSFSLMERGGLSFGCVSIDRVSARCAFSARASLRSLFACPGAAD